LHHNCKLDLANIPVVPVRGNVLHCVEFTFIFNSHLQKSSYGLPLLHLSKMYEHQLWENFWFIPFANKIHTHLQYWLHVKMKGRHLNVKKGTLLRPYSKEIHQILLRQTCNVYA